MGKHFLVSGGAGFIGSHIAHRLVEEGHNVTIVDNLSNGLRKNMPPKAHFIELDLSTFHDFEALKYQTFDAVFHLAAQSSGALSFDDPRVDFKSHLVATFHLLQYCLARGIGHFLYASSTTTYGDPQYLPVDEQHSQVPKTYYAVGKRAAETYVGFHQSQGLQTTILRLPNVYGPGQNMKNQDQGMVSIFLSYILEGQPIPVKGSLDRFRDFIYIDDVVEGFHMALGNERAFGRTFNLASGNRTTVREILNGLTRACGDEAYPVEVKGGTPGDQSGMVCDVNLIEKELGFRARTSIDYGIKKTVEYEKGVWRR